MSILQWMHSRTYKSENMQKIIVMPRTHFVLEFLLNFNIAIMRHTTNDTYITSNVVHTNILN